MTVKAQGLDVVVIVRATLSQRLDVITERCQGHKALLAAQPTQRLTLE
jgi:hypothetical protein